MKKKVVVSSKNKKAFVTIERLAKDQETGFTFERHTLTPGFIAEKHLHTDFEWVHVLNGELKDEDGSYSHGSLKVNDKDSVHTPYTETGCALLIFTRAKRIPVE